MRHSLLWRIAIPYAALLVLVMGGLYLYLSSFLRSSYLEQIGDELLAQARLVTGELAPIFVANPHDTRINDLAHTYAAKMNGRVTIILPDGTVVGESTTPLDQLENHANRPEFIGAMQKKETIEIRYSATLKSDLLYAAVPLVINNQVAAVVRMAYPLNQVQSNLNHLLNTILITTSIAAVLGILMAITITRYTLSPLDALHQAVSRITSGEVPEIDETHRKDEISRLQAGFRGMSKQLETRLSDLRTERGKLEAVLMNMTDGIVIVDSGMVVKLVNPAAETMFDALKGEAVGHTLIEMVRQHQIVELWRRSRESGAPQTASFEVGANRMYVQAIATPLGHEMEGSVLLVFQNLTRIRRLETVRRDFVSNVSHELRTPLASLKALAETLEEGALEDPPAARRFLRQMDTEIDNLTQIVQELLELSRIESGRVPLQLEAVNPCKFLDRAIARMQLQAERAGLVLRLDCAEELPLVQVDAERILQVLTNLIHNAVKFTQPGGEIILSATAHENEVVVSVRDTGVGIAREDLERIFERFYKADRSRSGGGTGLGLSIARHLVESHSGRIWAESEVGTGSTFYFTLPVA
jgi:two-component system phosphate regulon sensor histidine kinase PhoR